MATTRNIGQILVEKACELDSQYTPDRFNDAGEALDIILSHFNEGSSTVATATLTLHTSTAILTLRNLSAATLESFYTTLMRETSTSTPTEAIAAFNTNWASWDATVVRPTILSDLLTTLQNSAAIPAVNLNNIITYQIQYCTINNQTRLLYIYYDPSTKTNPIVDFCAETAADTSVTLSISQ